MWQWFDIGKRENVIILVELRWLRSKIPRGESWWTYFSQWDRNAWIDHSFVSPSPLSSKTEAEMDPTQWLRHLIDTRNQRRKIENARQSCNLRMMCMLYWVMKQTQINLHVIRWMSFQRKLFDMVHDSVLSLVRLFFQGNQKWCEKLSKTKAGPLSIEKWMEKHKLIKLINYENRNQFRILFSCLEPCFSHMQISLFLNCEIFWNWSGFLSKNRNFQNLF